MTSTVLDIYNGALSAVHAKGAVSSLNENSRERDVCSRWYPLVRDTVQEAAYWPGCQTTVRLSLHAERTSLNWSAGDPAPQFLYAYVLPGDYLRARHLVGYEPFTIEYDVALSQNLLMTNVALATLVYSRRSDEVHLWTPGQRMATIYGLAAHIAGPLSGNNQLKALNLQLANNLLEQAQSGAANAQQYQLDVMPAVFAARGAIDFRSETRFLYPVGNLFAGAVVNG